MGRQGLAAGADIQMARLTPGDEPQIQLGPQAQLGPLPEPLDVADEGRYRRIFELQDHARWREADRLIQRLDDPLLMGHVLAQRYLHPTGYRSSYHELADWLGRFGDYPEATRIYRLAMERKPADAPAPPGPTLGYLGGHGQELRVADARTRAAARSLFAHGISAWRRGAYESAATQFARLANLDGAAGEAVAAGAFWAARAHMVAGHPRLVDGFLRIAADSSDEFYGLLAQALLGDTIRFDWHEDSLNEDTLDVLMRYPAAQRAVALAQVGQGALAEEEIRKLAARATPETIYALAALAEAARLPAAQMRVAQQLRLIDGRRHDGALYPLPAWRPAGGFAVSPALIYAIVRAESAFDVEAESSAGARGLMQLLPGTAAVVADASGVSYAGSASLYEPPVNLAVGQAWIQMLAGAPRAGHSLIHLLVAYNAGQTRLTAWLGDQLRPFADDPLLFIESIPVGETRSYVKKVLANLWAYRARLGQPNPSLRALAENRWPGIELPIEGETQHARAN
jgi:soluble lytic murein transglycosylase-like protein